MRLCQLFLCKVYRDVLRVLNAKLLFCFVLIFAAVIWGHYVFGVVCVQVTKILTVVFVQPDCKKNGFFFKDCIVFCTVAAGARSIACRFAFACLVGSYYEVGHFFWLCVYNVQADWSNTGRCLFHCICLTLSSCKTLKLVLAFLKKRKWMKQKVMIAQQGWLLVYWNHEVSQRSSSL